ncbi:uncharacterized protein LOC114240373 [Bombyx mandarina]|uniref:Uncharacterized protein LOC114240373 n=1 Tax=Bombyx mandarina TaxID=7092 RepID=A0A6J2JBB1_BOMMA|nr:uncharacterized protein LOC114240373 [Bombyx mandarina]
MSTVRSVRTDKEKWIKSTKNEYGANKCKKSSNRKTRWRRTRRNTRWRLSTKWLIPLIVLNVGGQSNAVEILTSSVLASILGYPSTCILGSEVRPCTLTLTCWLRGGTGVRGCGSGWLFSCCASVEAPGTNNIDNSIPSSDWKYKVSPPKLRTVPQRSVVPTNVFRRRVDDDATQGGVLIRKSVGFSPPRIAFLITEDLDSPAASFYHDGCE